MGANHARAAARQAAWALGAALLVLGAAWRGASAPTGAPSGASAPVTALPAANAVLERLPRGQASADRAMREARERLRERPEDARLAALLAERHLRRARVDGDPREAGRGLAILAPWASRADAPADVLLLRAALGQHLHDFDGALADLDALLRREPDDRRALRLRASLLQTLGRLDEAADGCRRLAALDDGPDLVAQVCLADLASLRGDRDAAPALAATLSRYPLAGSELAWVRLVLAEIAEREGRDADAERLFVLAQQDADSPYARVAYADRLISDDRASAARALLADAPATDAVAVLHAIALRRLDDPAAPAAAASLRERFATAAVRGDGLHLREHARFALDVEADAARALELARRNWDAQKEPADLLLLARAARAAGRDDALAPVRDFVAAHSIADRRLERVLGSAR